MLFVRLREPLVAGGAAGGADGGSMMLGRMRLARNDSMEMSTTEGSGSRLPDARSAHALACEQPSRNA